MTPRKQFIQTLIAHIKYPFDRNAIRAEFENHLDELTETFTDLGMSLEDAELEAVHQMGNPEDIGKQLNAVHNPIIAWLYFGLKIVLVISVVYILIAIYPSLSRTVDIARAPKPSLTTALENENPTLIQPVEGAMTIANTNYTFLNFAYFDDNSLVITVRKETPPFTAFSTNIQYLDWTMTLNDKQLERGERGNYTMPGIPEGGFAALDTHESLTLNVYSQTEFYFIVRNVMEAPESIKITVNRDDGVAISTVLERK